MKTKLAWAIGALLLLVALAVHSIRRSPDGHPAASVVLPAAGPITIAASGDTVLARPLMRSEEDAGFDAVVEVVRGATLAITNLEMNLLGSDRADAARATPPPRWTFGSPREAAALRSLGFDIAAQANNHAADYGPDALIDTTEILVASGLVPVGGGRDLDQARAPVLVGGGARRVAVLAVAISAAPESMATRTRGAINGRPGVNPLRYVADVTLDAPTFETLRRSAPARQGGREPAANQFAFLGTNVRKGTKTSVALVPDARDVEEILAQVRGARADAEAVVLSVHSHEPSNDNEEPAELFRTFAHQAIDAGAGLIVGHGPHRLRGIEAYGGGVILYSVGNFLYRPEDGAQPSTDPYDTGIDMYSLAMGVPGPATGRLGADSDGWWSGAVAVASFDAGALQSLQVHPIDLGAERPAASRGIPRKPAATRAARILDALARLSRQYGTRIRMENGVGHVEIGGTRQ